MPLTGAGTEGADCLRADRGLRTAGMHLGAIAHAAVQAAGCADWPAPQRRIGCRQIGTGLVARPAASLSFWAAMPI